MTTPLVSVVIPTHNRPQYLPRAVQSALSCQGDDVEVIVVPNGPDQSWRESLAPWAADPRVSVSPIEIAHGNVARNHGMSLARGKYLRFLDDDDYLLPAAREQVDLLDSSGADVCSGFLVRMDAQGKRLGVEPRPESTDFVCAATFISGFTLPTGNIFLRSALKNASWDESIGHFQDDVWMMDLAATREWAWVRCDDEVGVWLQHGAARVSSHSMFAGPDIPTVKALVSLHAKLAHASRLTDKRTQAIASGLWDYVHRGFPYHPIYWTSVARKAAAIDPKARPPDPAFTIGSLGLINPLLGEWLLLPVRRITRSIRDRRQQHHRHC